jgi:hypothetical protein
MCRCDGAATAVRAIAREDPIPAGVSTADISMRYLGPTALLLKGPVSRRVYALSPRQPVVPIDARDAEAFRASPLFDSASRT